MRSCIVVNLQAVPQQTLLRRKASGQTPARAPAGGRHEGGDAVGGKGRLNFLYVFMQAISPGQKTLEEMARWTPATITAWRFGRLLKAAYWTVHLLVSWLAQDLVAPLPPPTNGILYLFGDGSHATKRGTKNPVAQKGRKSKHHPWFFSNSNFGIGRVSGLPSACDLAKRVSEMNAPDVIAKAEAASVWCRHASDHARESGGKPWIYLPIPHDQIAEQMTLAGFAARYTYQQRDKSATSFYL